MFLLKYLKGNARTKLRQSGFSSAMVNLPCGTAAPVFQPDIFNLNIYIFSSFNQSCPGMIGRASFRPRFRKLQSTACKFSARNSPAAISALPCQYCALLLMLVPIHGCSSYLLSRAHARVLVLLACLRLPAFAGSAWISDLIGVFFNGCPCVNITIAAFAYSVNLTFTASTLASSTAIICS